MPTSLLRVIALATVTAGSVPAALHAQPVTGQINFDDLSGSTQTLPAGYGSTAALGTAYQARDAFGNVGPGRCAGLTLWANHYSDLTKVAIPCTNNTVAEIFLQPLGGRVLTLGSFDFGSYPATDGTGPARAFGLRIFDANWNELFARDLTVARRLTVTPNVSSASGLYIQWGRDWNVGIDNISYQVSAGVAVVPEPATVVLVAGGLAVAAGLRVARRRSAERA